MFAWFQSLSGDLKSVIVTVIGSLTGAIVGGAIKWFFDRKLITELKQQREEARSERKAAIEGREGALKERETALVQLAAREAENQERQRKLDELQRIVDGRATDVAAQKDKLQDLLKTLRGNEAGLWTTFPKSLPFADFDARIGRRKPLIITIANNKGGVSKTTITGNLLAYFDKQLKLRVLVIDLDYQGSLSTMLRLEQDKADARKSNVNALLTRGAGLGTLYTATRRLGERLPRSELASAFYELALFEDRLMVEWLLQEGGDDVRYRLASVLLQDGIQDKFDVILIDCPPRLTTGTINALCASTHVLVPTMFNPIAAEPVANFIRTSKALMDHLNPKLEFLGVVETLTPRANEGQDARAEGRRVIAEALKASFPGIHILKSDIPRRTALAEGGVAYLDGGEAKKIFDALGNEIKGKVGL
jgi:cellulose biosynthesis protein BcsQ